jgi:adenylosuccinate synthase
MLYCDAIVDVQSGDTGKGKVTHSLLDSGSYDLVLRYNGGSNAGHTIYHKGVKVVTHQVPAGVLYGIRSLIGLGCVVNVEKLEQEIQMLNDLGFDTKGKIFVDKRAHMVLPEHIEEDGKEQCIGTTKQGIGPAYKAKYGRTGRRIEYTGSAFAICDSLELFNNARVLAEGAQGFQLDIDWGDYPYVTSSHCTVGSVCLNGVPPRKIIKVFGVAKAYETYVGAKQFQPKGSTTFFNDRHIAALNKIQEVGQEYGATTGRKRQVNWINVTEIQRAIKVNGITTIIINKLDVLEQVGMYGYIVNGVPYYAADVEEFKDKLTAAFGVDSKVIFSRTPHDI